MSEYGGEGNDADDEDGDASTRRGPGRRRTRRARAADRAPRPGVTHDPGSGSEADDEASASDLAENARLKELIDRAKELRSNRAAAVSSVKPLNFGEFRLVSF
jgi:hypothetical protein